MRSSCSSHARFILKTLVLITTLWANGYNASQAQPLRDGYIPSPQGSGGGMGPQGGGSSPGTPSSITVPSTDTDGNYTISWSSVGLAQYYQLQERYNNGGWVTYGVTSTSKSFSGKADGSYQYQVRACSDNPMFWEPCGGYRVGGTLQVEKLPGVPSSITVPTSTTVGSYTVNWGAASGTVARYEHRQNHNGTWGGWISAGLGQSINLAGKPDGSYYYQVRACNNLAGCGSAAQSATFTVVNIPGAPTNVIATLSGSTLTLTWNDAPGTVERYDVRSSSNAGATWSGWSNNGAAKSKAETLQNSGQYRYEVRACNTSAGCGPTAASNTVTVNLPPMVTLSAGTPYDTDRAITVHWSTSGMDLSQIAFFEVERNHRPTGGAWTDWSQGGSINVVNQNGVYRVEGHAPGAGSLPQTALADGTWAFRLKFYTHQYTASPPGPEAQAEVLGPPGAPVNPVAARVGENGITLNWSDSTGRVDHYEWRETWNGSVGNWNNNGGAKSKTLTGKSNGNYSYEIRAFNTIAGYSPVSTTNTVTVRQAPALTHTAATPYDTDGHYTINWSVAELDLSQINYFQLSYTHQPPGGAGSSGLVTERIVTHQGSSHTVDQSPVSQSGKADGLWTYQLEVRYLDGSVNYSPELALNILHLPGPVSNLTATQTADRINLAWNAATGVVDRYEWCEYNCTQWTANGTSLSANITIQTDGNYQYQVRACNAVGCGASLSANVIYSVAAIADAPWSGDTTPVQGDTNVGALEGNAGVSGGAATYTIPLTVPPGRNTMQPALSLTYSSRSGNGLLGQGWNLSAGGAIHRCASLYAIDDYTRNVQLNNQDRLCLNGERLKVYQNSYGASGSLYHPETDITTRITLLNGGMGDTSSTFKVEYKSGLIEYYGETANARLQRENATVISSWLLQRTEDRAGNQIHYTYDTLSDPGNRYLTLIEYTGRNGLRGDRQVLLAYQNRPDIHTDYLAGTRAVRSQRLHTITTKVGATIVTEYQLNYRLQNDTSQLSYQQTVKTNGQLTLQDHYHTLTGQDLSYNAARPAQKTLLKSIRQCNTDTQGSYHCLPETELTTQAFVARMTLDTEIHTRADGTHYPSITELGYSGKITPLLDMDGDGTADLARANADTYINGESTLQLGPYDSVWLTSLRQYTNLPAGFLPLAEHIETEAAQRDLVTDWNLDGRKDLIGSYDPNPGDGIIERYLSIAYWNPQTGALQRKDFPSINVACSATYWLPDTLALPGGMQPFWEIAYRNCNSYVLDANGDGKDDLIIATRVPTSEGHASRGVLVTWQLYLHCGPTTAPDYCPSGAPVQVETNNNIQVTDFEGDGIPDLLGLHGGRQANDQSPLYYLKTVTPVYTSGAWQLQITDRGLWNNQNPAPLMLDANGDGLTDLLIPAGTWKLRTNQGNGLFTETTVTLPNIQRTGIAIEGHKYLGGFSRMLDYNRDGLTDLVVPKTLKYPAACSSSSGSNLCDRTRQYESYSQTWQERAAEADFIFDYYDLYEWAVYEAYIDTNGNLNYREVTNAGIDIVASLVDLNVADYNLDGAEDLITRYGRASNTGFNMSTAKPTGIYIHANPNAQVDLLTQAEDAFDRKAVFGYQALYQPGDFTETPDNRFYHLQQVANNSPQFPYQNFGTATQMVALYRSSDGLGGLRDTELRYQNARYHLQGRGFQGFQTIIEWNRTLDTRSKTHYAQTFPHAGKITARWHYAKNRYGAEQHISYTENAWGLITHQNAFLVYNPSTETQYHDLETGAYLYRTRTDTTVDTFGNPTLLTETYAESGDANLHRTETHTTYLPANEADWWLNKPDRVTHTRHAVANRTADGAPVHSGTDQTQQTETLYDPLWHPSRQPQRITTRALLGASRATNLLTTVETLYNDHGLPQTLTTTGTATEGTPLPPRTVTTAYTADGYFIATQTNALGHTTAYQTDARQGQPTEITDPNGLVTQIDYDAFGRLYRQKTPGQPSTYTTYAWCSGIQGGTVWCPDYDHAKYRIGTRQIGSPDTYRYYDGLGREVRSLVDNFTVTDYYQIRTTYNAKGQKTMQSEPYTSGVDPNWNYTDFEHYDGLGRLTEKRIPQAHGNQITLRYTYTGFTTTITAIGDKTLTLSRRHNGLGQLINTTDANGYTTAYAYNGAGQPITLRDANGNPIHAYYNALGHKEWVQDPNMGRKDFGYNSLSELQTETDANGNTQTYTYDPLGRMQERRTNGTLTGRWTWDHTGPDGGLGLLRSETSAEIGSPHRYEKTYYYTETQTGRKVPYRTQHRIIEPSSNQTYDTYRYTDSHYGRPTGIHYAATGLTLNYTYTAQGYLHTLTNAADGHIYQTITDIDARGNITARTLGHGQLQEQRIYLAPTGQLADNTVTTTTGSNTLHELIYTYDGFNNLNDQTVTVLGGAMNLETYQYDNLHRLIHSNRTLNNQSGANIAIHYTYDPVGNITHKSDYAAAYTYGDASRSQGNAGPHAVRHIQKPGGQTTTYTYDNNGNLLTGDGKTLTYNPFNKPLAITKSGQTSTFLYGADLQRYRHQQPGSTTYYLDELEIEHKAGQIHYRHPISDIALHTKMIQTETGAASWELHYTHRDRLGSVVTLSRADGTIVEHRSYDPFGKPRRGDFADATSPTLYAAIHQDPHGAQGAPKTPRGFTGHEHLDSQELIHMNGRVYDYNLARFLSVDPFIQEPGNSQSFNPYSYILNNPLSGVDPTGYLYRNPTAPARPGTADGRGVAVNVVSSCFATACTETRGTVTVLTVSTDNGASNRQGDTSNQNAGSGGRAGPTGLPNVGDKNDENNALSEHVNTAPEIGFQAVGNAIEESGVFELPSFSEMDLSSSYSNENSSDSREFSDSSSWYWGSIGVNVAGFASTYSQYGNQYDDMWKGKNGKWYSVNWGGNQWTGARSATIRMAKILKNTGVGLFFVGAAISAAEAYASLQSSNYIGVWQSAMGIGWGAAATFGGWVGFAGGVSYFTVSELIKNPTIRSVTIDPVVEGLCSFSDC